MFVFLVVSFYIDEWLIYHYIIIDFIYIHMQTHNVCECKYVHVE